MYEMEGPRPASRRRPADFSASLRRSTTYQGQERSQRSGRPDHRVARGLPAPTAQAFLFANKPGVSPKPGSAKYFLSRWLRAFFSPNDRGFPQPKGSSFPFAGGSGLSSPHMTRGFPSAIYLEVFPFAGGPGPSSHRVTRGFPSAAQPEVFPAPVAQSFLRHRVTRGFPSAAQSEVSLRRVAQGFLLRTWLGVSPPPCTLKFSLRQWPEVPLAGFPLAGWHRAFPETRGPKVCPIPGGPGFPPHRWLGVSSLPVAPDFSWP